MIAFVTDQLLMDNKTHTPANILLGLNRAKNMLHSRMKRWCNADNNWWRTSCVVPMAVSTREYALPDGTLYSSAKKCSGKIDFLKSSDTNDTVARRGAFITFHDDDNTTADAIEEICVRHKSLWVKPLPSAIFNTTLFYSYIPDDIANSSSDYDDWIPGYEEMIPYKYCMIAKIGTQDNLQEIAMESQQMMIDFIKESGNRIIGHPNFGENSEDYESPNIIG